jgi:hypothetical protein
MKIYKTKRTLRQGRIASPIYLQGNRIRKSLDTNAPTPLSSGVISYIVYYWSVIKGKPPDASNDENAA